MPRFFDRNETSNQNQDKSTFRATVQINCTTREIVTILSIITALFDVGSVVNIEERLPQQNPAHIETKLESEGTTSIKSNISL